MTIVPIDCIALTPAVTVVARTVPVVLLVVYAMLLGLLGLFFGPARRRYVTVLSQQALGTAGTLMSAGSQRPGGDLPAPLGPRRPERGPGKHGGT
jgi:hypothetical protein